MRGRGLARRVRPEIASAALGLLILSAVPAAAQSVTVSVPASETFLVRNVQNGTTGATTTRITWSTNNNFQGNHFRISVKADAANFTAPASGRTAIASSKVSWTIAAATNGTGTAGTLSSTTWTVVYNASNGKKSGTVDLNWNMASVGTNVRSGNHQLTLHWRLESVP